MDASVGVDFLGNVTERENKAEATTPQPVSSTSARLLIVDDDAELCYLLRELFVEAGYAVDFELDGERGVVRAEAGVYDLLILDVRLPGLDGFEILRRIRVRSTLPVLMLTANAEERDRIAALDLGADDYVAKPFSTDELLARTRALIRRSRIAADGAETTQIGDLALVPSDLDARFRGRSLGLTAMEYEILRHLMRFCGQVVSRDSLSLQLYHRLPTHLDRTLDQHVSRLRRKLGSHRNMILSVRGIGYQLRHPESSEEA